MMTHVASWLVALSLTCWAAAAAAQGCPFGFTSSSLPVGPQGGKPATGAGQLLRTNTGSPEAQATTSLTAGRSGPVLLQDVFLVEKLANFVRERIPERVVHARGASAKGYFEVTQDVSSLTYADVLTGVGKRTPVRVRFSTVIGGQNSPEVLRDPRGFAVKFYTNQGNWDLVGNNFPVFFIRDGIRFPDMVHSLKPNPQTGLFEAWRHLDFLAREESLHMLSWLQDDVGIPLNYRTMDGAGVHTYSLVSRAGNITWVKFHWRSQQGVKSITTDAQAAAILAGGAGNSHATQDLHNAIAAGNFPSWKLYVQTMDPSAGAALPFDPLDPTKTWPEDRFPLREVGRLVLNKNNGNFFQENEMLAFSPSSIVPGIGFSPDKLLQARIFSYADAQRYRLGGNYLMLPVNAPAAGAGSQDTGYLNDGVMNFKPRASAINYFPSSYADGWREEAPYPTADPQLPAWDASATPVRANISRVNWDTQQPGDRYRSWDAARQGRFVDRWVSWLVDPRATSQLRQRWVDLWAKCDEQLGAELAARLSSALAHKQHYVPTQARR